MHKINKHEYNVIIEALQIRIRYLYCLKDREEQIKELELIIEKLKKGDIYD